VAKFIRSYETLCNGYVLTILADEEAEYNQTLMKLGLTVLQAKTYLALIKLGESDVNTIAESSNIVREEIYRIMPTLERKGLVERTLGRPTIYMALPLKEGLTLLIQRRKMENTELEKKTNALIQNLPDEDTEKDFQKANSKFIITSEVALFRKRFERFIQTAQSKIDVVASPVVLEGMLFHHFEELKEALAKGVEIRLITEKTDNRTTLRNMEVYKKKQLLKIKHLVTSVPVTMALFDGKEVNLRLSKELVPSLWTNNPEVVKLAASYFEDMWRRSSTD
jgi:sugar-specific transcriptional regulator TrmB